MFESLQLLPPDPLLGIIERFNNDANPQKIDLGVGIYKDEDGRTPVLECVKGAEAYLLANQRSKCYLGPRGDQRFTHSLCALALGDQYAALRDDRIAALQTPGGCGALRVAAEVIARARPRARIWVSDPTWANHVPLLGGAGLNIQAYPYYDYEDKLIRFDAMLETLSGAAAGDLVLLHGCCHNPCGADLDERQWLRLAAVMQERQLVPFVDMAYQGFGESLDADAFGLRLLCRQFPEAVFTVSCSKNFGLYRDRVGVVAFLLAETAQTRATLSNLTQIVRGIYSMPPDHGAAVVAHVLNDPELRAQWTRELALMRDRINDMRQGLVAGMSALGFGERFDFVTHERGMFSFLGISPDQVKALADGHGIYMADSSRINVAGLNRRNLDYFCAALSAVLTAMSLT